MGGPILATILAAVLVTAMFTWLVCRRLNTRDALRAAGLTRQSAAMYFRAVKIIRRLDGLTELDGEFAADILTPETKQQVTDWVADYRKALDSK